jgi:hypothetical protein
MRLIIALVAEVIRRRSRNLGIGLPSGRRMLLTTGASRGLFSSVYVAL